MTAAAHTHTHTHTHTRGKHVQSTQRENQQESRGGAGHCPVLCPSLGSPHHHLRHAPLLLPIAQIPLRHSNFPAIFVHLVLIVLNYVHASLLNLSYFYFLGLSLTSKLSSLLGVLTLAPLFFSFLLLHLLLVAIG